MTICLHWIEVGIVFQLVKKKSEGFHSGPNATAGNRFMFLLKQTPQWKKMYETMDFKTLDISPQRTVICERWK